MAGRVAQRIRRPTSNRKIVGSIPIVVSFLQELNIFLEDRYVDLYRADCISRALLVQW